MPKKNDLLSLCQTDPVYHLENIQGVITSEVYQKEIMRSVAKNKRTVVAACHDVGKSWVAAKIVLWFTSTFPGSKVITTAPTFKQVRMLLWSEIRAGFQRSKVPLGGNMTLTEWKIDEDWFALGYTAQGSSSGTEEGQGDASSFQGYHAEYVLVVFDEATGIKPSIWVQMEGLMTSSFVRFLGIGNPTTKACEFFKCFSNPAYHKIFLTCLNSPNFPANGIHTMADLTKEYERLKEMSQEDQYAVMSAYKVVHTKLLSVDWVMTMLLKLGPDHPIVQGKCFGTFPDEDDHSLFPLSVIQQAQVRSVKPKDTDIIGIGVDVARYGSDKTVITKIHGNQVTERKTLVKRDITHVVGEVVRMLKGCPARNVRVAIDATGIGSGVVDGLLEKQREQIFSPYVEIRECHFGEVHSMSDTDQAKYINLKAKIFIELLEALKASLCLPDDDIFLEQLPTIRFKFDSKGRWVIESKDEYRVRTRMGSPDDADSLALANYARSNAVGVGEFSEHLNKGGKATIINYRQGVKQW